MAYHIVSRGESLSSIAHKYGQTWQELAKINHLQNPNGLHIGQKLLINDGPGAETLKAGAAVVLALKGSPGRPGKLQLPPMPAPASPKQDIPPPRPGTLGTAVAGDVTEEQLAKIMPNAGKHRIARFLQPLNTAMKLYEIDTHERRAAFLAQISVESGQLHNTEENLNYSAIRLREVWPKRFPDEETAKKYAHNPEALANKTYGNRLGNGDEASGDGYRYRGRGLMQTTGRENYRAAGYESNPDALADPQTAAETAALFWKSKGLNAQAAGELARSSFDQISRTVNGGSHGSKERWEAYERALKALRPASPPASAPQPVLVSPLH